MQASVPLRRYRPTTTDLNDGTFSEVAANAVIVYGQIVVHKDETFCWVSCFDDVLPEDWIVSPNDTGAHYRVLEVIGLVGQRRKATLQRIETPVHPTS